MEDIIMESVENLNGNVSQKIMSCKGGHDENQQVPSKILPKLFYSRDLLIKLKNHPSSKEKPAIFDDLDRVKNGIWDPEHWHSRTAKEPKRSNSATVVGAGNKEDQQDKKRGKEEGDEFCFTPQRRSFVSGCHVVRRQDAEPAVPPVVTESVRESALPTRRVGSGRLTGRDVEPAPVPAKEPRDRREPLRAPQRERTFEREPQRNERGNDRNDRHDRNERNERSERNGRTFQPNRADPRDKDPAEKDRRNFDRSGYDRDYSSRGDRGDRYNSRRKNEDDTPEWFLGGPSSQHDTIELRGFDEEKDRKQSSKATVRKESTKERQQSSGVKKSEEPEKSSSRPGSGLSGKVVIKEDQPPKNEVSKRKSPINQDKMDFNIEDFLKMDGDLNGLGLGPSESEETSRGSKASRWFGKTSDLSEASKPSASENIVTDLSGNQDAARSLLEMLQKGSQQQQSVENKKIVTAEELERSSGKFSKNERSSDDGMTVFNKLLAQVQETTTKPHSVMNSAPTEQDILANLLGKQMKIEAQPPQPVQHHAQQTQDALSKFLQQQQNNQIHHQNTQQHNTHQMLQQQHINHLHQQQQQSHLFSMHSEQPHSDVHNLMRDLANGHPQTLNQLHMMTIQKQHQQQQQLQQLQQQQHQQQQQQQHQQQQQQQHQQQQQQHQQQQQQHQQQQQQQRQAFVGSPQQSVAKQSASSSSPLSFTPTAVMRKMGAEKDKAKAASMEKGDGAETGMGTTSSPPASSATSNRLTGRTASQVQGASRVSSQMRMNDVPVVQQQQQQQQQLLTGRPLVKGQESVLPFQQQQQQSQQTGNRPFGLASASNAAITGVAVKMLEQQHQHQLLAAAVAASANQTQQQLKQQILQQQQQQQRTSPLQQSLLAFAAGGLQSNMALQNRGIPTNVPVGNRTHFRPIHPQPMIPPMSGYSPYMGNQASLQTGQNRMPNNMGSSSNQFYGISPANNIRGQSQGLNALAALQQQAFSGNRSPNMLQGGNSLSRWFPPEIFSQAGSGQMPTLPPMPSQKILSLEELERLHTSPMSH